MIWAIFAIYLLTACAWSCHSEAAHLIIYKKKNRIPLKLKGILILYLLKFVLGFQSHVKFGYFTHL